MSIAECTDVVHVPYHYRVTFKFQHFGEPSGVSSGNKRRSGSYRLNFLVDSSDIGQFSALGSAPDCD